MLFFLFSFLGPTAAGKRFSRHGGNLVDKSGFFFARFSKLLFLVQLGRESSSTHVYPSSQTPENRKIKLPPTKKGVTFLQSSRDKNIPTTTRMRTTYAATATVIGFTYFEFIFIFLLAPSSSHWWCTLPGEIMFVPTSNLACCEERGGILSTATWENVDGISV